MNLKYYRLALLLLGASTTVHMHTNVYAQDIEFVGPGDNWFDGSNWSLGTVPISSEQVLIDSSLVWIFQNGAVAKAINVKDNGLLYFGDQAIADGLIINASTRNSLAASPPSIGFEDSSSAGTSKISLGGRDGTLVNAGALGFAGTSTAANANITLQYGSELRFSGGSSAGAAVISSKGSVVAFDNMSDAGTATIINYEGSLLSLLGSAGGSGATIVNAAGAAVDVALLDAFNGRTSRASIGSLSGEGDTYIGAAGLTLGYLALNDTIDGSIRDGASPKFVELIRTQLPSYSAPVLVGGELEKVGSGTLTLTGDNTYTGGTTINAGVLALGDGGSSGSIVGSVLNNGILAFNRSDEVRFDGIITGSGSVQQNGAGTTVLTGKNTYTGGTYISNGSVQIGDGGFTGSLVGNVDFNRSQDGIVSFSFNRADTVEFLGNISGSGIVNQLGVGTTVFSGENTFSGGLRVASGTVQAGIANNAFGSGYIAIKQGANLDLAGLEESVGSLLAFDATGAISDGNINLGRGSLTLNQTLHGDFSGTISGAGGLTLNSPHGSSLSLTGVNTYSGVTAVKGAELIQGAQGAFSSASAYTVSTGGTLDFGGFSTGIAALDNNGDVLFGGNGGTVIAVAGNYTGNGGTISMSTVLAGDNSQTDILKVGGDTSGLTAVNVNNRGGLGAQTIDGIKIIDVAGVSDGDFKLNGDYVTKDGQQAIMTRSAYAYTLQKNSRANRSDGDWYLVSQTSLDNSVDPNIPNSPDTPLYSAGAPVYEAYAGTLQALNKLPTLQQRVGSRYFDNVSGIVAPSSGQAGEVNHYTIWGRVEGSHNRLESTTTADRIKQDVNTFIMQTGVDGQFYENESGRLIAGIIGQYGKARSSIANYFGDGSVDTQGWGLGGTVTWYGNAGFYVDGQAQINWYNSDLDSDTINKRLNEGGKAFGYAFSIETGKRLAVDEHWDLTPQAQLMFSSVDFDSFTDRFGADVSNHDGNSLTGRVGLAASYSSAWQGEDGKAINTNVYGIANLYQELLGATAIDYAGTRMSTYNDRTWGGIGAGGSYAWAGDKYAIYGEGSINTSFNNFADSYILKGNVGFKVKW